MTRHIPHRCCTLGASYLLCADSFRIEESRLRCLGLHVLQITYNKKQTRESAGKQIKYFRTYSTKSEINGILLSETLPTDPSSRCEYIVCNPLLLIAALRKR